MSAHTHNPPILASVVAQAPLRETPSACSGGAWWFGLVEVVWPLCWVLCYYSVRLDEREGSSTGPGRHGPKAAPLGAG